MQHCTDLLLAQELQGEISVFTHSAIIARAMPKRLTRQVMPASQLWPSSWLGRQLGRLATKIMFHPAVNNHKTHKETTRRLAMYVVFLMVLGSSC
jgi:hypothetical protein